VESDIEGIEYIYNQGRLMAMVIRREVQTEKSRFFTPDESSFQFGLIANQAGFIERPHSHHVIKREITDLQQMLVIQYGIIAVDFFDDHGYKIGELTARPGDAVLLISGVHSLRGIEDFQCVSVKQGPFLGPENDKVEMEVEH
jgi:hypothetical protein